MNNISKYDRGCRVLVKEIIDRYSCIIDRYSCIFEEAKIILEDIGFSTIITNDEIQFKGNKDYTQEGVGFDTRWDLLLDTLK